MGADLGERLANVREYGRSMLRVNFNDFSDEQNRLQRCEGRLAFKLQERFHEGAENQWYGLGERLGDLIDRFDQKIAVFVGDCTLSANLFHFGSFNNFTFQKLDNFLDVSLTDKISDQIKNLLVYFERGQCVVFDDGQDVVDIVFQNLGVVFAQLENFLEYDHFHVVVIILLEQIQITLNGYFDSTRSRGELSDCVGAFKQYRWTLRRAHHENGTHKTRFLAWVCLANLSQHLKNNELENIANFRNWVITLHQVLKEF